MLHLCSLNGVVTSSGFAPSSASSRILHNHSILYVSIISIIGEYILLCISSIAGYLMKKMGEMYWNACCSI
ncbi:hypothetical protein M407DRAFT_162769 [Tulasnella calospora MUT 4182]|uniref:Uncharacterized protein n=1 Tax=Tulasnella calospora MUT 4182 TaxID=1051891 RepID=A0A0C3Q560_9AGAM|nr:hypothetical protein M407DRAFT_162769 [Tulasnella calospora MUT 4182]